METLKGQLIATVSNGGYTRIRRNVTYYREGSALEGMDYGRVTLYGGIYRVARGKGRSFWEVRNRLRIYPEGHPLAGLNPKD
jgi:hypothetical protein